MKYIVGTRGSELALAQTNWVIDSLKKKNPDIEFEVKIIKTKGDKILNRTLDKIGGKGVFVKEIENELISGEIHMAVHSLKDLPSEIIDTLKICRIPYREDKRDVLVFRDKSLNKEENPLMMLPKGARIGTGSKRRVYQIAEIRDDFEFVPVRGNIRTRIEKLESENLDAVVLAAAGIKRLGLDDIIGHYFENDEMIPSPGQGSLAIEIKADNKELEALVNSITDEKSDIESSAEREFMKMIGGSCHIPMGASCSIDGEDIVLEGVYGDENGELLVRETVYGKKSSPEDAGRELAKKIIEKYNRKKSEGGGN